MPPSDSPSWIIKLLLIFALNADTPLSKEQEAFEKSAEVNNELTIK